MYKMKYLASLVLIFVLSLPDFVNAECGSTCLNATGTTVEPPCNETTGECLFGCIAGYTGSQCHLPCVDHCTNCTLESPDAGNETVCDQCDLNYYKDNDGCVECSKKCQSNSSSDISFCNTEDGECYFGCKVDYYGKRCELNCSVNCLMNTTSHIPSCDRDSGDCVLGCNSGFHGTQCDVPCSTTCRSNGILNGTLCNQTNGFCEHGCQNGYFGMHCNETCNVGCKFNDILANATCKQGTGYCDLGCVEGYYSEDCSRNCSQNCKPSNGSDVRACNQTNGFCEDGCQEGYFGLHCNETCSVGCKINDTSMNATCKQDTGYCDLGCLQGYYSEDCSGNCSQNCKPSNDSDIRACNETNGHCEFGCQDGFYSEKCDRECSVHCEQNVSSDLPVCEPIDGTCSFGCDNSSYGAKCEGICSTHCRDNPENSTSYIRACNQTNGHCEFGCVNGYYGLKCDHACSSHCKQNMSSELPICDQLNGTCNFRCVDRYYGYKCDKKCSHNCVNELCDDGPDGCCFECRFADAKLQGCQCLEPCSDGCKACYRNLTCTECKDNFWGPYCTGCSSNCVEPSESDKSRCSSDNGFCNYGCKTRKYGTTCSLPCPEHCLDNCNQTSGSCVDGCKKSYYGEYCNSTCSYCPGEECFSDSGTCVAENCDKSWFGSRCDKICPDNCKDEICERTSGACYVCIAGYFGDNCNTTCVEGTYGEDCKKNCSQMCNTTCTPDYGHCECKAGYTGATCFDQVLTPSPPTTEELPFISGYVGGAAALLLAIGVIVLCVWRKKKEKIVRRRKPKNRRSFASALLRPITMLRKSDAGPKRILVDSLLPRVKDMPTTEFETDFNGLEEGLTKDHSDSKKPENLAKNCYMEVKPYDENRVFLYSVNSKETKVRYRRTLDIITGLADMDSDYINASYIEGYASAKHRYIAAQGPIMATKKDFWKMVAQEKTSLIVMLMDIDATKPSLFKKYWPDDGTVESFGEIEVRGGKEEIYADFCVRTITVQCYGETRSVKHLQFTSWPPDGPPTSSAEMIEFFHKFRSIEPEEDTPIIVHCTNGVGRTGCFIALDLLVDEGEEDHSVDVSQCAAKLRSQRVNMIQSEDQYEFVYKTVAQVLGLRSYPVDRDKLKKEWDTMKKDDNKITNKTFDDLCESVSMDETDCDSICKNQGFTDKNREGSDIPEDKYRPKLQNEEYINAVYIDTYKKKNGMIVTQMPTPETLPAFLQLICQEQCRVMIMMNEEDSEDETQIKYWPSFDKATKHGDFFVATTEILDLVNFLKIQLSITDLSKEDDPNNELKITLYQFAKWNAGEKCPKNEVSCLSLVRDVIKETHGNYEGRILVHCLNGSERSGLFCSLYILLEKLNYEREISVVNTVRKIKTRRATVIPNLDQFCFIYACLEMYIESYPSEIKYTAEETKLRKRSQASSGTKRISMLYSKPNKKNKRTSELYAKPDKKKKGAAKDRDGLVDSELDVLGDGHLYAKPDKKKKGAAKDKSGLMRAEEDGDMPMYSVVNKKGKRKADSKETTVSIKDVKDVKIVIEEQSPERISNPYAEMDKNC